MRLEARLPEVRAVGIDGGNYPALQIEEAIDGRVIVHEIPDPREKWIAEYTAAVSQSRGQPV